MYSASSFFPWRSTTEITSSKSRGRPALSLRRIRSSGETTHTSLLSIRLRRRRRKASRSYSSRGKSRSTGNGPCQYRTHHSRSNGFRSAHCVSSTNRRRRSFSSRTARCFSSDQTRQSTSWVARLVPQTPSAIAPIKPYRMRLSSRQPSNEKKVSENVGSRERGMGKGYRGTRNRMRRRACSK